MYHVRIPVGPDICHCYFAYTVLQTVQRPGVYSAAYGTVQYKEPLKYVFHPIAIFFPGPKRHTSVELKTVHD